MDSVRNAQYKVGYTLSKRNRSKRCISRRDVLRCCIALRNTDPELGSLLVQIAGAVKKISWEVQQAPITGNCTSDIVSGTNATGDEQKALDVIANEIMTEALQQHTATAFAASEEEELLLDFQREASQGRKYVVVFDPLDGSRNIECNIPVGTIFGVYPSSEKGTALPGSKMLAAGYALYSSSTMMVVSAGEGTHGFTLDVKTGEFVETHPNLRIPERGQIYSVNDARYFDWPKGLQNYIDNIRRGKGKTSKQYSARYVCSLVADVHRTLLYGGIAMNPRYHLRLLYEAIPMAFIVEQAGGKATDGRRPLLSITPNGLHEKLPVFVGSSLDIEELLSYNDVQQIVNPGYKV